VHRGVLDSRPVRLPRSARTESLGGHAEGDSICGRGSRRLLRSFRRAGDEQGSWAGDVPLRDRREGAGDVGRLRRHVPRAAMRCRLPGARRHTAQRARARAAGDRGHDVRRLRPLNGHDPLASRRAEIARLAVGRRVWPGNRAARRCMRSCRAVAARHPAVRHEHGRVDPGPRGPACRWTVPSLRSLVRLATSQNGAQLRIRYLPVGLVLASGQGLNQLSAWPVGIVVDAAHVYWSSSQRASWAVAPSREVALGPSRDVLASARRQGPLPAAACCSVLSATDR
jgi:hypothetical protein